MKKFNLVLGIAVTLLFGYLVARNVSISRMTQAFRAADGRLISLAAGLSLTTFIVRTVRWRILLNFPRGKYFVPLFKVNSIGYFANNVLPARAGELVRSFLLAQKMNVRISFALTTIFVERVFDGLTLILLLAAGCTCLSKFPQWLGRLGYTAGLIFFSAVVLLILAASYYSRLKPWVQARSSGWRFSEKELFKKIWLVLDSAVAGLSTLKNTSAFVSLITLSLGIWLIESLVYWLVGIGFHLSLPCYAYILMVVIANLGTLLPTTPGYLGTFEYLAVTVLGLFGINNSEGLSIALMIHAAQFIPITSLGFAYFIQDNLSFSQVSRDLEREEQ